MAKNIIILNGSPRKKGNTSALTAAFAKGAEEAGN
jgi:multimeric flavodoxin WrbA